MKINFESLRNIIRDRHNKNKNTSDSAICLNEFLNLEVNSIEEIRKMRQDESANFIMSLQNWFLRRNFTSTKICISISDIFYADLRPVVGSEQGGIRPVLIIQNDVGNRHSPTVICAAITSKMNKAKLPTHIEIDASAYGIERDSVILLEQLRTIDKRRLKDKVCHLDQAMLDKVNHALEISLELTF